MNKSVFLYSIKDSNLFIEKVKEYIETKTFHDGLRGNKLDLSMKRRKDLFINDEHILRMIDNHIFDNIYATIEKHFGDIKYREKWKVGKYYSDVQGFYGTHQDTGGETDYRKMSMIFCLSEKDKYEGGELVFDDLNIKLKLDKAEVVLFDSSLLHHVTPVISGVRIILIGFMFGDKGYEIKKRISPNINLEEHIKNYIPLLDNIKITYTKPMISNKLLDNKNLGDIDYSDRYKNELWTDKDDYYFQNNNSDILLVSFAGMGWKDSIPTFIFFNFLKSYNNIDKLFLRDIDCRYYINGLKNSTKSFQETIELYKQLIHKKKYRKIIGLGCSSGGYAAILYGQLLGFNKIIAISPQTVLSYKKIQLIGDIYNAPKTCEYLSKLQLNNDEYQKALDLNNYRPFSTPIDIHYSVNANNGSDKKHALYLESSNCKIIEHPGDVHMLALVLRDNGKLKTIIDEALQ